MTKSRDWFVLGAACIIVGLIVAIESAVDNDTFRATLTKRWDTLQKSGLTRASLLDQEGLTDGD